MALVALDSRLGVGDKFHAVVLVAQTSMGLKLAQWQFCLDIGSPQQVVATIVVEFVDILQEIEFVGTKIGLVGKQGSHIHRSESLGQLTTLVVVPVEEVARLVLPRAILPVGSPFERWTPRLEVEAMGIVELEGEDVLVERSPLARDIVLIEPLVLITLTGIFAVENIFSTIRQATVGIRIADTPVKCIATEGMPSRQLSCIGGAALIVVLCRPLWFRLCADALSERVAAVSQLIEDILQLVFVLSTGTQER